MVVRVVDSDDCEAGSIHEFRVVCAPSGLLCESHSAALLLKVRSGKRDTIPNSNTMTSSSSTLSISSPMPSQLKLRNRSTSTSSTGTSTSEISNISSLSASTVASSTPLSARFPDHAAFSTPKSSTRKQSTLQQTTAKIKDVLEHAPQKLSGAASHTIDRGTEKLRSLDRLTKIMSDKSDMSVIKGILILKEEMSDEAVEKMLKERMVDKFLRFRSKVEHGAFIELMPHEIHLNNHIHHIQLPDDSNSEDDLRNALSQYVNKPFIPGAPLWEAYIVHNYAHGFVMMLRVHHSIGDGAALAMVFNEFCDQDIEFPQCKPPQMSTIQKILYCAAFFVLQIVNLIRVIWKSIYMIFGAPDPVSAIKLPVQTMAKEKQISWTRSFDLDHSKAIGRPYNATLNDVFLCVIAGALDRFQQEKSKENNEFSEITECDIRCIHPINTRNNPVIKNPDNDAAFLFALLPLGMNNPEHRLREIKNRMDHLKSINEKFYAKFLIQLLNFFPGRLLKPAMDWMTSKVTVVVSNVRGPSKPLSINGDEITDCIGLLPSMHGIGLSVCIFSYCGKVRLGLTTDTSLSENPKQDLIRFLEEEYDSMEKNLLKVDQEKQ